MSVAWMICKLGTVLNVALRGQAKLRKNHTNPIVVAKALLGSDAVAVAVAVLILFRYRLNCCLTRPSKLYTWVLLRLLGAVALAVAVASAFAVAVAVTDTFRMGGDHESYKAL